MICECFYAWDIKSQLLNRRTLLTSSLYHDLSSNVHIYVEDKFHQSMYTHYYTKYYNTKREWHNGGNEGGKEWKKPLKHRNNSHTMCDRWMRKESLEELGLELQGWEKRVVLFFKWFYSNQLFEPFLNHRWTRISICTPLISSICNLNKLLNYL